jgi:hypothetical protein
MRTRTVTSVFFGVSLVVAGATAPLHAAEAHAAPDVEPAPTADYAGPVFDTLPPIEKLWDDTILPVTGVSLDMRDRAVSVLGDGSNIPYPDGVSDVLLNRQGVVIYGDPVKVRDLEARLAAKSLQVAEIVPTDGERFVEKDLSVSSSPPIQWYAGQHILSTSGTQQCSSGYAYRVQWNGTWWYESTAGHCAYDIPGGGTDWGTAQVSPIGQGYHYEPFWPGIGWGQVMWGGSLVCCPPLRPEYDVALFSVNPASQATRPIPVSHVVTNYCPGGCHRQTNTSAHNITSAITNSGSLSENVTSLVKSGFRTGTSTGTYVGVRTDGRGQISNLNNCGAWFGDSGGPVFRWMANGVQAVGTLSSAIFPTGGSPSPSYCGIPAEGGYGANRTGYTETFSWVHVLQAATGATVVTTTT